MNAKTLLGLVILIATIGCDQATKSPPKQSRAKEPASFTNAFFHEITPTAEGGAYAESFAAGLYYLHGEEARKVKFPATGTNKETSLFLSITPGAKGGAYAQDAGGGLWFLIGEEAKRISEVPSLGHTGGGTEANHFALYIHERRKRLEAEHKLEDRPVREDYDSNDY